MAKKTPDEVTVSTEALIKGLRLIIHNAVRQEVTPELRRARAAAARSDRVDNGVRDYQLNMRLNDDEAAGVVNYAQLHGVTNATAARELVVWATKNHPEHASLREETPAG